MNYDELISLWTKAFNWLYEKDLALFETNVQERAIAGRLAIYLQYEFDPHFEKMLVLIWSIIGKETA